MAKKSRRARKTKYRRPNLSSSQLTRPVPMTGATQAEQAAAPQVKGTISTQTNLRDEYRYVITDLKRIGIIAVAMVVVMIVLAVLLI